VLAYRCGVAVRVWDGLRSVGALVTGRAASLRHRNAFMSDCDELN